MLGRYIDEFCTADNQQTLARLVPNLHEGVVEALPWKSAPRPCRAWLHTYRGVNLLELEDAAPAEDAEPETLPSVLEGFLQRVESTNSVPVLAQHCADVFAEISGYDRVMIYRFHEDWSGQVIAERRSPPALPYLGLHYPASDIPSQARQLYTANLLRTLRDVNDTPVPVLAAQMDQPLDLSHSILRAMSSYHVEYLRNMNVSATLTASLMVNGQLWGMMACHHLKGKPVPQWVRQAAAELAERTSRRIEIITAREAARAEAKMTRQMSGLEEELSSAENMVQVLCFGKNRLHALFEIESAALYTAGAGITIGNAPSSAWIGDFVEMLMTQGDDVFSFSDTSSGLGFVPTPEATGALAIILTRDPATVLLGFRIEFEHELTWGGDMVKAAPASQGAERMSPRKSFAAYKETIRGKSLPWRADDLERARLIAALLKRLLPQDDQEATSVMRLGIEKLGAAVPASFLEPLLDIIADGMSLFISTQAGVSAPSFASQALLNQFNLDDNGSEFSLDLGDFFRHIGLPEDLLSRMHFGPQQIEVMTGRSANRTYLVQQKQILEITTASTHRMLAALTFWNITGQARLLEATEAARVKADHANRIKSAFLANTTHEVRTPLNGILGMSNLLKKTRLTLEQRDLVETIERSGNALLKLVNDILDFSKIEAGKLTLESIPFNLHQLLKDIFNMFQPIARPGVKLLLSIDPGVPDAVAGDPGRLRQILINLLNNALKFTGQGHVKLRVQPEKTSTVYVTLSFAVEDTGRGMSEQKLSKLFDRFDQADASTARNYGGTGLGLSISKELVTLMGGEISAVSTQGAGTTMTVVVTLLIDQPQAEAVSEGRPSVDAEPPKPAAVRVLLVDDSPINVKVAAAMLGSDGCAITVAWNGAEAVELVKQETYDVILMDCQMPEMDGFEATARIREWEGQQRRTPIIAVTASNLMDGKAQCLAAGMDDFLAKPIGLTEVRKLVHNWAARSKAQAAKRSEALLPSE